MYHFIKKIYYSCRDFLENREIIKPSRIILTADGVYYNAATLKRLKRFTYKPEPRYPLQNDTKSLSNSVKVKDQVIDPNDPPIIMDATGKTYTFSEVQKHHENTLKQRRLARNAPAPT